MACSLEESKLEQDAFTGVLLYIVEEKVHFLESDSRVGKEVQLQILLLLAFELHIRQFRLQEVFSAGSQRVPGLHVVYVLVLKLHLIGLVDLAIGLHSLRRCGHQAVQDHEPGVDGHACVVVYAFGLEGA